MEIHLYLWLFSLVTSCTGAGTGFNDKPDLPSSLYHLDWMRSLPDETPLSAVAIPGSHESLTLYGGPLAVCQVWTLRQQLYVGIRYLETHVGIWFPTHNRVYIRDGNWMFWQHMDLEEAIREISDFLRSHKSETVVMKVSLHGLYQKKVEYLVKTLMEKYRSILWTKQSVPTLGEARGKIVFLRSETFPVGADSFSSHLFESNRLQNVGEKLNRMRQHMCDIRMVVTENAASVFRSPKSLARSVNLQLTEFLRERLRGPPQHRCLGVFSLDFPSAELIQSILQLGACDCSGRKGSGSGATGNRQTTPKRPERPKPTDSLTIPGGTKPKESENFNSNEPESQGSTEQDLSGPTEPEKFGQTEPEPAKPMGSEKIGRTEGNPVGPEDKLSEPILTKTTETEAEQVTLRPAEPTKPESLTHLSKNSELRPTPIESQMEVPSLLPEEPIEEPLATTSIAQFAQATSVSQAGQLAESVTSTSQQSLTGSSAERAGEPPAEPSGGTPLAKQTGQPEELQAHWTSKQWTKPSTEQPEKSSTGPVTKSTVVQQSGISPSVQQQEAALPEVSSVYRKKETTQTLREPQTEQTSEHPAEQQAETPVDLSKQTTAEIHTETQTEPPVRLEQSTGSPAKTSAETQSESSVQPPVQGEVESETSEKATVSLAEPTKTPKKIHAGSPPKTLAGAAAEQSTETPFGKVMRQDTKPPETALSEIPQVSQELSSTGTGRDLALQEEIATKPQFGPTTKPLKEPPTAQPTESHEETQVQPLTELPELLDKSPTLSSTERMPEQPFEKIPGTSAKTSIPPQMEEAAEPTNEPVPNQESDLPAEPTPEVPMEARATTPAELQAETETEQTVVPATGISKISSPEPYVDAQSEPLTEPPNESPLGAPTAAPVKSTATISEKVTRPATGLPEEPLSDTPQVSQQLSSTGPFTGTDSALQEGIVTKPQAGQTQEPPKEPPTAQPTESHVETPVEPLSEVPELQDLSSTHSSTKKLSEPPMGKIPGTTTGISIPPQEEKAAEPTRESTPDQENDLPAEPTPGGTTEAQATTPAELQAELGTEQTVVPATRISRELSPEPHVDTQPAITVEARATTPAELQAESETEQTVVPATGISRETSAEPHVDTQPEPFTEPPAEPPFGILTGGPVKSITEPPAVRAAEQSAERAPEKVTRPATEPPEEPLSEIPQVPHEPSPTYAYTGTDSAQGEGVPTESQAGPTPEPLTERPTEKPVESHEETPSQLPSEVPEKSPDQPTAQYFTEAAAEQIAWTSAVIHSSSQAGQAVESPTEFGAKQKTDPTRGLTPEHHMELPSEQLSVPAVEEPAETPAEPQAGLETEVNAISQMHHSTEPSEGPPRGTQPEIPVTITTTEPIADLLSSQEHSSARPFSGTDSGVPTKPQAGLTPEPLKEPPSVQTTDSHVETPVQPLSELPATQSFTETLSELPAEQIPGTTTGKSGPLQGGQPVESSTELMPTQENEVPAGLTPELPAEAQKETPPELQAESQMEQKAIPVTEQSSESLQRPPGDTAPEALVKQPTESGIELQAKPATEQSTVVPLEKSSTTNSTPLEEPLSQVSQVQSSLGIQTDAASALSEEIPTEPHAGPTPEPLIEITESQTEPTEIRVTELSIEATSEPHGELRAELLAEPRAKQPIQTQTGPPAELHTELMVGSPGMPEAEPSTKAALVMITITQPQAEPLSDTPEGLQELSSPPTEPMPKQETEQPAEALPVPSGDAQTGTLSELQAETQTELREAPMTGQSTELSTEPHEDTKPAPLAEPRAEQPIETHTEPPAELHTESTAYSPAVPEVVLVTITPTQPRAEPLSEIPQGSQELSSPGPQEDTSSAQQVGIPAELQAGPSLKQPTTQPGESRLEQPQDPLITLSSTEDMPEPEVPGTSTGKHKETTFSQQAGQTGESATEFRPQKETEASGESAPVTPVEEQTGTPSKRGESQTEHTVSSAGPNEGILPKTSAEPPTELTLEQQTETPKVSPELSSTGTHAGTDTGLERAVPTDLQPGQTPPQLIQASSDVVTSAQPLSEVPEQPLDSIIEKPLTEGLIEPQPVAMQTETPIETTATAQEGQPQKPAEPTSNRHVEPTPDSTHNQVLEQQVDTLAETEKPLKEGKTSPRVRPQAEPPTELPEELSNPVSEPLAEVSEDAQDDLSRGQSAEATAGGKPQDLPAQPLTESAGEHSTKQQAETLAPQAEESPLQSEVPQSRAPEPPEEPLAEPSEKTPPPPQIGQLPQNEPLADKPEIPLVEPLLESLLGPSANQPEPPAGKQTRSKAYSPTVPIQEPNIQQLAIPSKEDLLQQAEKPSMPSVPKLPDIPEGHMSAEPLLERPPLEEPVRTKVDEELEESPRELPNAPPAEVPTGLHGQSEEKTDKFLGKVLPETPKQLPSQPASGLLWERPRAKLHKDLHADQPYPKVLPVFPFRTEQKSETQWRHRNCNRG